MNIVDRFMARIVKDGDCWLFDGKRSHNQCFFNGKVKGSHRMSYELFVGDIPAGMVVMHKCDVGGCVNPAHLSVGTQLDNMQDMKSKKRHLHGEASPRALLTRDQVAEIKATPKVYGSGVFLAKKFNISTSQVSHIRAGKQWIHI